MQRVLRAINVWCTVSQMAAERVSTPLTRALQQRGIRHIWLADLLGVKKWTFTRIEKGEQSPPAGYYERAAEILGLPVESIVPSWENVEEQANAA